MSRKYIYSYQSKVREEDKFIEDVNKIGGKLYIIYKERQMTR